MTTVINTTGLLPMQQARLNKCLDTLYRYRDGIRPLREELLRGSGVKSTMNGMIDYNRRKFNSLNGKEQADYEAKLRAKTYYMVDDHIVPKIVYDAVSTEEQGQ
jgi:hypothetical protein